MATSLTDVQKRAERAECTVDDVSRRARKEVNDMIVLMDACEHIGVGELGASAAVQAGA